MGGRNLCYAFLFFHCLRFGVYAKPVEIVTKVGDPTILHCSVSPPDRGLIWHYGKPSANSYKRDDTEVYISETGFASRFWYEVEKTVSSLKVDLHVNHTTMDDAGTFRCTDSNDFDLKPLTRLIVIEVDPICETSVPLQEVIGPNDCGIQPDEIRLTCNVTYDRPNASQPILEWRRIGDNQIVNQTCNVLGNTLSCTVSLYATLPLNGTSYICTTTKAATTQYSCSTAKINELYAFSTSSSGDDVHIGEKHVCKANSSQRCTYAWKQFQDNGDSWTVSNDHTFTPKQSMSYRCEANCPFRNTACKILSRVIHVSEKSAQNPPDQTNPGQTFGEDAPNGVALFKPWRGLVKCP